MEIKVNISECDFKKEMEKAIEKSISENIEPKISKYLNECVNSEEVAKIIENRIIKTLSYGSYGESQLSGNGISNLFNERVVEISKKITDQELKNFLFEAIFNRIRNK